MKTYQYKTSQYSKCKFFKFFKQKINFYLSFDVNSVAYSVLFPFDQIGYSS